MKNNLLFTTYFICCIFLFTTCIETDGDSKTKCGKNQDVWTATDVKDHYQTEELLNSFRMLYFENTSEPVDICPDDPVKVNFYVYTNVSPCQLDQLTSLRGKVYWGLSEEKYVNLNKVESGGICYFYGTLSVSIKSFFGQLPGWIGTNIIFTIPTQGDIQTDKQFLLNQILSMSIIVQYNHF
ncbi:MAG: hypothetical protein ABI851_13895 [Saprospiraceae bacterium]